MKQIKNFFYQVIKIKALITGAGGFVGKHLADYLKKLNIEVIKISNATAPFTNTLQAIRDNEPNYIFHLAGTTNNQNINEAVQINVNYASAILETLAEENLASTTKVLFMGSAAEYGPPSDSNAVSETQKCQPTSIYGKSKLSQTELALKWNLKHNGHVKIIRPFTILGSGMPDHLAIGSFFNQLTVLKKRYSEPCILTTGNLHTFRDFIDIDDAVSIMWKLINLNSTTDPIYNLCSNEAVSIKSMVEYLISLFKINVEILQSTERVRINDIPIFFGDNSKLRNVIGPYKFMSWKESLKKMVEEYESN